MPVTKLPTLYHKGKGGKIYSWDIFSEGDTITVSAGTLDGKKTVTPKKVEQKNIGRSNETSLEDQAIKEAKAMWIFKKDRKYSETQEGAQETLKLPMLAEDYFKKLKDVVYPVTVQPKLDGVRCMADNEDEITLTSRGGLPWTEVPHIISELESILDSGTVLDGELYIHGHTFQEITRLVKKNRPESSEIEYHVYDIPTVKGNSDLTWIKRKLALEKLKLTGKVVLVPSYEANSYEEVMKYHDLFVSQGYEGAIVRSHDGTYLYGYRSSSLLKVKKFDDAEFKVVGYDKGVGRYANSVIWVCHTEEGSEFRVNHKCSITEKEKFLKDVKKYIGKWLKVKFFGRSEDNHPRFPVGLAFRLEKDMDKK